jgi:sulfopyruvate decarboxylase subunit alpha
MEKFNDLDFTNNAKTISFHKALKAHGVDFATGVPCGVIRHIIKNFEDDKDILHIPATSEQEAVGIAAGAAMAGKKSVLYMQNSGMFAASNNIASLLIPYKIPIYMAVSYRGCESETAPQHFVTGNATEILIKSMGLNYAIYNNEDFNEFVDRGFYKMKKTNLPFISLFKRGWQCEVKR